MNHGELKIFSPSDLLNRTGGWNLDEGFPKGDNDLYGDRTQRRRHWSKSSSYLFPRTGSTITPYCFVGFESSNLTPNLWIPSDPTRKYRALESTPTSVTDFDLLNPSSHDLVTLRPVRRKSQGGVLGRNTWWNPKECRTVGVPSTWRRNRQVTRCTIWDLLFLRYRSKRNTVWKSLVCCSEWDIILLTFTQCWGGSKSPSSELEWKATLFRYIIPSDSTALFRRCQPRSTP